jgi:hypothetical protein
MQVFSSGCWSWSNHYLRWQVNELFGKGNESMATTYARASSVVGEAKATCNDVRALLARIDALVALNVATGIDWGAAVKPAVLEEDAATNLQGFTFSRQNLANVIYSLTQIQALLRNGAVSQGDHIGNVQTVADVPLRYPI